MQYNPAIGGTFLCFLMPVPNWMNGEGCGRKGIRRKTFCQIIQMRIVDKSIPDWSRPGLPTTASGIAQQGTCGNYATVKHSQNKRKRKATEEAAGSVERKMLAHKGGYFKYWNND